MSTELAVEEAVETPDLGKHRVTSNAGIYLVSQVVSWCVAFLSLSIIPRALGEKAVGQISSVGAAVQVVAGLLVFGIDTYLIKEIGRDRNTTSRLVNGVFGLRIAIIVPATLLYVGAVAMLKPDLTTWEIGIIAIVAAHVNFFVTPMRAVLAGWEEAVPVSVGDLLQTAAPLAAIPFLRYGPLPFMWANLAGTAVLLILQVRWVGRRIAIRPAIDPALTKQLFCGGAPFFVNLYVLSLYGASAVFLLKHFVGDEAVGVWAQAGKLIGTFLFIPTAVSAALLPAISRLAATDDEHFHRVGQRVLGLLVVIGLPVTVTTFMLAHPITTLLYHERFAMLPAVLQALAFTIVPLYIVSTMYQFLVAQGRAQVWSFFLGAAAGTNFVLGIVLIPIAARVVHNGAVGAAWANVIAETGSAICALLLLKMNPFDGETIARTARALVATAVMAGAMWATRGMFLVVPAAVGIVVFAAAGWLLRVLMPDEQEKLAALVRRYRRRAA